MKYKAAVIVSILVFGILAATACSNTGKKKTEVPNPMVAYDSLEQVEDKMDYFPAVLPESTGFELKEMFIIADTVVDLRYQNASGAEVVVRSQKDAEGDISGYQNLSYSSETYGGITYSIAENPDDKALIANFTKGSMTYSVSATGLDEDSFKPLFTTVIDEVGNQ